MPWTGTNEKNSLYFPISPIISLKKKKATLLESLKREQLGRGQALSRVNAGS